MPFSVLLFLDGETLGWKNFLVYSCRLVALFLLLGAKLPQLATKGNHSAFHFLILYPIKTAPRD
jgi:hypothetical protein